MLSGIRIVQVEVSALVSPFHVRLSFVQDVEYCVSPGVLGITPASWPFVITCSAPPELPKPTKKAQEKLVNANPDIRIPQNITFFIEESSSLFWLEDPYVKPRRGYRDKRVILPVWNHGTIDPLTK